MSQSKVVIQLRLDEFNRRDAELAQEILDVVHRRVANVTEQLAPTPPAESSASVIEQPNLDPTAVFNEPSAAPAPPAPVSNVVQMPTAVELDNAGLPWAERIHSSAKSKSEDGTWRRKRGISDSVFDSVMSELLAARGVVEQPAASAPPPPKAAPAPPAPSTPAAEVNTSTLDDYISLVQDVTAWMPTKLSHDQLTQVCATLGIASLPSLGTNLALVPKARILLEAIVYPNGK
jgi:hypothetical protein